MHLTKFVRRFRRAFYNLAVHLRVAPYRRQWLNTAADWDTDYASGKLDAYANLSDIGRYGILIGLLKAFPRKPRVLDVGCGVGLLPARLGADALSEYVGIDPSIVAVEEGRSRDFPKTSFVVGELPTPDMGKFDVIVLNEMIYYVDDIPRLLESVRYHLVQDGWLLTSVLRHPGAIALDRQLGAEFREVEALMVSRETKPKNAWRVVCHTHRASSAKKGHEGG